MRKIAIIGAGPTGIYTLRALLKHSEPMSVSIYEKAHKAGVGMPYSDEENVKIMLANIASIEIPPVITTYLEWLLSQTDEHLALYNVKRDTLHVRQFLPRVLLGEYFRDSFLMLLKQAEAHGFDINLYESCEVTDLQATKNGIMLWADNHETSRLFDAAAIATGHLWPKSEEATGCWFPSPWSGLMDASIAACRVGILGTSLSGLDAAMVVAIQHGTFIEHDDESLSFHLSCHSKNLSINLMSRSGILPEADFYCPIPYEPLNVVTEKALRHAITTGHEGLLDRIFGLIVQELYQVDPGWSDDIRLNTLSADTFADAWFAERKKHDPFNWACKNLYEVERNKRKHHTVPWRYAILRLHEAVETIVPHLNAHDRQRFSSGIARIFIDNYAAIPSESVRRLIALKEAGVISINALGPDYKVKIGIQRTVLTTTEREYEFDVFIDARGQQPLKINDLPFPSLRSQLEEAGEDIPNIDGNFMLKEPALARGRVTFGALPWLMHNRPFVQGLVACAQIGTAMAKAIAIHNFNRKDLSKR